MKKIRLFILSTLALGVMVAAPLLQTNMAYAADPPPKSCSDPEATAKDCIRDGSDIPTGTGDTKLGPLIKNIVNILLFVLGAIAVIMIVIGGIRYTLSNGDSSAITGAKNTILYAVIGLVVALLAYAIVNFVLGAF